MLDLFAFVEKGELFSGSEHSIPAGRVGGRRRCWRATKNCILSEQLLGCSGVIGPLEGETSLEGAFYVPHALLSSLLGESHELRSRCQRNFIRAEMPTHPCMLCFSFPREVQGRGEVTVWFSALAVPAKGMQLLHVPVPKSREKTEPEHVLAVGVYMCTHTYTCAHTEYTKAQVFLQPGPLPSNGDEKC